MSEENKIQIELTAQNFEDFLTRADALRDCPSCGKNQWVIPENVEQNIVYSDVYQKPLPPLEKKDENDLEILLGRMKQSEPKSMSFVVVICDNCLYVRHHHLGGVVSRIYDHENKS